MNFDELQVVWNAQQETPLFAIDERAMHNLIRGRSAKIDRYIEWFELSMISVTLSMAVLLPLDAWREGDGTHQYVVALICLIGGLVMLSTRNRRRGAEVMFDQSVKSIAERTLDRVDRHIRSLKLIFWCFHIPIAVCAAIGLTFYTDTRIPLIWGGVLLVTLISYAGTMYDIRVKLRPRRAEVEELLDKLMEAEEGAGKER